MRRRRATSRPDGAASLPVEFVDPHGREQERLRVDERGITGTGPDHPPIVVPWRYVERFGGLHATTGARCIGMALTDEGILALDLPRPAKVRDGFHALLPSLVAYGRDQDELAHYLDQLRRHFTAS